LDTGYLNLVQLNFMLKNLPVDISFIDENDRVSYYSDNKERIFPRSPAVIGREVQNCHPQKSLDKVNKIIESFKKGEKDSFDFWIDLHGRFIYIRYFAVRDEKGNYLGTLEVSQDITKIRELEGEKRLLD
jgi:PAS domain S-box